MRLDFQPGQKLRRFDGREFTFVGYGVDGDNIPYYAVLRKHDREHGLQVIPQDQLHCEINNTRGERVPCYEVIG